MLFLENKLIEYMNIEDEKNALLVYNEIFDKLLARYSNSSPFLRNIKNYLISLSGIISYNYYNKPICKKMLYNIRLKSIQQIDRGKTLEDLHSIGEGMIRFYVEEIASEASPTKNPTINSAIDYIHNNLDKDLTLDEVAKNVYVSSSYLSHLFSKCIKLTFSQYIIHARIEKSKKLLGNTSLSIMDIALECGFNSQSYFSNVFKKHVGLTPKKYREEF